MQINNETMVAIGGWLSKLDDHARLLQETPIRRVWPKAHQVDRARALLTEATRDAERAAALLKEHPTDIDRSVVDTVNHAVELLRRGTRNASDPHPTGDALTAHLAAARSRSTAVREAREAWTEATRDPSDLLAMDFDLLGRSDWKRIGAAARELEEDMPFEPWGAGRTLGTIASGMSDWWRSDDTLVAARKTAEMWQLRQTTSEADIATEIGALMDRGLDDLGRDDLARLKMLVHANHGRYVNGMSEREASQIAMYAGFVSKDTPGSEWRSKLNTFFERWASAGTVETRTAELDELRALDVDELTPEQLQRLDDIGRLHPPRHDTHPPSLVDTVGTEARFAMGDEPDTTRLRHAMEALAFGTQPLEVRSNRIATLMGQTPDTLTQADWRELQATLRSNGTGGFFDVPQLVDSSLMHYLTIADADKFAAVQGQLGPWSSLRGYERTRSLILRLIDRPTPTSSSSTWVSAAAYEVPTRRSTAAAVNELQGLTGADRIARAASLLDDTVTPPRAGMLLDELQPYLADPGPLDEALEPVRARALQLLERNVARVAGDHARDVVRGYSNHPDYAELGRIRSDVTLMLQMQDLAKADASRATGEVLSW